MARRPRLPAAACAWLLRRLRAKTSDVRPPDFVIGGPHFPYLRRWWVIPRNRFLNIYYHEFLRSDEDRALHDHPWASMSVILAGGYVEVVPDNNKSPDNERAIFHERHIRFTGDVTIRGPRALHRVELHGHQYGCPTPAYTLFITGPRVREWGFLCERGWIPQKKFVDGNDRGRVGAGCDADHPSGQRQP